MFLREPIGFFIFSCFYFFMYFFLHFFVSSDVFALDSIYSLHYFFTVCPVLCFCVVTAGATDLRERFLLPGIFYLTILPAFIKASLGLVVLSCRLHTFPLRFETKTWPICLNHTMFGSYMISREFYLNLSK